MKNGPWTDRARKKEIHPSWKFQIPKWNMRSIFVRNCCPIKSRLNLMWKLKKVWMGISWSTTLCPKAGEIQYHPVLFEPTTNNRYCIFIKLYGPTYQVNNRLRSSHTFQCLVDNWNLSVSSWNLKRCVQYRGAPLESGAYSILAALRRIIHQIYKMWKPLHCEAQGIVHWDVFSKCTV